MHWVSLGELSRTIELLHEEGVKHAVMAGQVKHNKIFSSIRPDWRLAKLLLTLPSKNTDSLIGAVARVLEEEGIELVDSTKFLGPLLPEAGVLTRRAPDESEAADIDYGRDVAQQIAALDLGQTVVVRDRACVAIEAMEGTDETIERAARIAGGQRLVVVKVSKPAQDMRFDVPVVGLKTIEVMRRSNATALAIDAGRTLLFDRDQLIQAADECRHCHSRHRSGEFCWFCAASSRREKEIVSENPIRVAVVGAGDFGRNHVRVWRETRGRGARRHRGHERRTRPESRRGIRHARPARSGRAHIRRH